MLCVLLRVVRHRRAQAELRPDNEGSSSEVRAVRHRVGGVLGKPGVQWEALPLVQTRTQLPEPALPGALGEAWLAPFQITKGFGLQSLLLGLTRGVTQCGVDTNEGGVYV